jgi:predicted secreted hydrolase
MGTSRSLAGEDLQIDALGSWVSPRDTRYPSRWRVRSASLGLDLTVEPVLANQELATTPRYWEGKVSVGGTRGVSAIRGQGYVELVGYAN